MATTTDAFSKARDVYRDSPNTFGHEEADVDRVLLKRIIGLVASQEMLHASIQDARAQAYYDGSAGMAHLWERLQEVEDQLRALEEKNGEAVKSREYLTNHRR